MPAVYAGADALLPVALRALRLANDRMRYGCARRPAHGRPADTVVDAGTRRHGRDDEFSPDFQTPRAHCARSGGQW
jgi:hypothetical protein